MVSEDEVRRARLPSRGREMVRPQLNLRLMVDPLDSSKASYTSCGELSDVDEPIDSSMTMADQHARRRHCGD